MLGLGTPWPGGAVRCVVCSIHFSVKVSQAHTCEERAQRKRRKGSDTGAPGPPRRLRSALLALPGGAVARRVIDRKSLSGLARRRRPAAGRAPEGALKRGAGSAAAVAGPSHRYISAPLQLR